MCFSASASFLAGGGLSTIGALTVRKAKKKREIPFAAIPLLFGIQQFIEGILWLSISSNMLVVQIIATRVFSLFAYALWPVFIPFAVYLLEPVPFRKKMLSFFVAQGVLVGFYLLYFILQDPVTSKVMNHSIAYQSTIPFGFNIFLLYIVFGVGSCLISSYKLVNVFGLLLFFAISLTEYYYATSFVSVWCFSAAVLSFVVYFFFRKRR